MTLDPVLIGSSKEAYHLDKPVHIVPAARRRHLALFGASGSGTTTLYRNMIASDIAAGHGVTVVDPHGQLVDDILDHHIPRSRTNDVVYFNPKDQHRAFALNLLDCHRPAQRGRCPHGGYFPERASCADGAAIPSVDRGTSKA